MLVRRIAQRSFLNLQKRLASSNAAAVAPMATDSPDPSDENLQRLSKIRNIGISAHIDSGKTTLTERILYYTGRIREIHDVRGKDGVGAKMDSMELEREKGITIQSAATYTTWKENNINIIDTPGHVDFTIEVERALRVLDGAVLVLCSVGGVQSQTCTVDRQMKRYGVPRTCFINKMDRMGANPWRVIENLRKKLHIGAAAVQIPIGAENDFKGVVDLVGMQAIYNAGSRGETVEYDQIPAELKDFAMEKRRELIETLADYDDEIADLVIDEVDPTAQQLKAAIRRATLSLDFAPVFMGSAFKNTSVQPALDGVIDYLSHPGERNNVGLDLDNDEKEVALLPEPSEPLVALAFKLEDTKYGQLTYMRVYQGTMKKGMSLTNVRLPANAKKLKLAKLVRMHSNEMEEVEELKAGEIGAIFGVDCASGDSFTDGQLNWGLTSMYVPDPVVSLSLKPKDKDNANFSKALQKFMKEDPTFRVHLDPESRETIISGMGELHLDIYVERMRREFNCDCVTGKPQVAFRETITQEVPFTYTHKKQTGGSGQFAKVIGKIEPLRSDEDIEANFFPLENEFLNETVGLNVPSQYIPSVEKGFLEACEKGRLTGNKITGVRFSIEDGQAHAVDSSDLAFRLAAIGAFKESYAKAKPIVLEPMMEVTVTAPQEFQANLMSQVNRRKGSIKDSDVIDDYVTIKADVSLREMFGYISDLRAGTQGKGEFTMEYKAHEPVNRSVQEELIKEHQKELEKASAAR